jgi:amidase
MITRRASASASIFTRLAFAGAICAGGISGCATARKPPPQNPKDYAFITYTAPAEGAKGLRLAVKDIIDVKGVVTTAGSRQLYERGRPATRDAECLAGARAQGAQIVGKTNVSEFALGVSGINEYFGTPKSPLKVKRKLIPGGSSSGSAVAVATGMADVAYGSDTAGSIRVPAACCGVFGLKTTFGLVSLKGVAPISLTNLDTVGPMAKDIPRLARGMDMLKPGFAAKYEAAKAAKPTARRIKIGRLYVPGTDPKIDQSIDAALTEAGFRVVRLSPKFAEKWSKAQADAHDLAMADGWVNDEKYLGARHVSPVTKAIIRLGELQYRNRYDALLKSRRAWQSELKRVFGQVDMIAVPTLQGFPQKIPFWGRSAVFEARVASSQNTAAVNLAGIPALAVPIPMREGDIPVTSVQLVGPRLSEPQLVNAGRLLTRASPAPTPPGAVVSARN